MTGPLFFTLHPHRRRARLLLPFTAIILAGQLACSTDQPTEPTAPIQNQPLVATSGPHPRARLTPRVAAATRASKPLLSFKANPAFGVSQAEGTGVSVLILADTDWVSTSALAASLADSGVQVTLRPAPESSWDGTNPSLNGFDVVIHLNGNTYDTPLSPEAQSTLVNFVQNGGGFVGAEWNGMEFGQDDLGELVLQNAGFDPSGPEQNCAPCTVNYQRLPAGEGHPVLAGLPASFSIVADGHDAGPAKDFATVLMKVDSGGPAVLVRELGSGRVVSFSFAPNYPWADQGGTHDLLTLQDPNVQHLYLNSVRWAAGSAQAVAVAQTITFEPIGDKVFGDPMFAVSASSSSGLPVNFTATGNCAVVGANVSLNAAGSCTITARQAGNDAYAPAVDVSRSFPILKAPATIAVGTEFPYDGTVKSANITTNPSGLSGVTVSYTLNGSPVAQPVNAGVYQVSATLNNPNYQAPAASGTLTIRQAAPDLHWTPGSLASGTPLGPSQLNATATGVGGASLTGSFSYTPTAGSSFSAGTYSLSVQFTPASGNYSAASKTVSITVSGAMNFAGFFSPVRNMPYVNTTHAGSAIPVKFTVGGFRGKNVLLQTPTSAEVACPAGAPENVVRPGLAVVPGLRSLGYSYSYTWKTSSSWAGPCRMFVLTLADGSTHQALFRFVNTQKGPVIRRIFGH
ncbi:MAG: PxKF domain-containing protein [Gemmatimonadales bacterium]